MRAPIALLALAAAAFALAGCDTTADKNDRAELFAKRVLATREKVVVKKPDPRIEVRQVQKVGKGKGAFVVVRLTNKSDAVLTDLPINVRGGGKTLNAGPDIGYLENHVAAIGGGQTTVWILPAGRSVPSGRLTARVGAPASHAQDGGRLPEFEIKDLTVRSGVVRGAVKNAAGPPQYRVDLYLTARNGGSYTAAAIGRVFRIPNGSTQQFQARLAGRLGDADLSVAPAPAVLQSP